MNDIAQRILASPKYRDICPDTVEREVAGQLRRLRPQAVNVAALSPSESDLIENAARNRLHMITGAFMTAAELKQANKCLASGDLTRALSLHASTRERLSSFPDVLAFISEYAPDCTDIADLACGLNPLWLGAQGYRVRALDIQGGCVRLINDWAERCNWDVQAYCRDLLCECELPSARLTLAMKLLPVLEAQSEGAGVALLRRIESEYVCVSFPTRTLGGRRVGMRDTYSDWLARNLPDALEILASRELDGELLYMLHKRPQEVS